MPKYIMNLPLGQHQVPSIYCTKYLLFNKALCEKLKYIITQHP